MFLRTFVLTACLAGCALAQADQMCNDRVNSTAPLHRFFFEPDGTVIDIRTGLQWQRCPAGYVLDERGTPDDFTDDACEQQGDVRFTWQQAFDAAAALNAATGESDWRLPNLKELTSILERKCFAPALNLQIFPEVAWQAYWSSTTYNVINTAATVDFRGGINATAVKDEPQAAQAVRLVR